MTSNGGHHLSGGIEAVAESLGAVLTFPSQECGLLVVLEHLAVSCDSLTGVHPVVQLVSFAGGGGFD